MRRSKQRAPALVDAVRRGHARTAIDYGRDGGTEHPPQFRFRAMSLSELGHAELGLAREISRARVCRGNVPGQRDQVQHESTQGEIARDVPGDEFAKGHF
jgi:hypothetical protein